MDVAYSMTIDDFTSGMETRAMTRQRVDELMFPVEPEPLDDVSRETLMLEIARSESESAMRAFGL